MRTIPDIDNLLKPLENRIHQHLIPALTGHPPCSAIERDLLALPVRLGGLGLHDPSSLSTESFQSSKHITAPLVALIISQDLEKTPDYDTISTIKKGNRQLQDEKTRTVYDQLTPELKQCVDLSKEKGSSSWLSVLPLEKHGFYLHKGEFCDALFLHYGWMLNNTPLMHIRGVLFKCGAKFSVNHAMTCHMGGFPTIRHKEIRDTTALLKYVTTLPQSPSSSHSVAKT